MGGVIRIRKYAAGIWRPVDGLCLRRRFFVVNNYLIGATTPLFLLQGLHFSIVYFSYEWTTVLIAITVFVATSYFCLECLIWEEQFCEIKGMYFLLKIYKFQKVPMFQNIRINVSMFAMQTLH